MTTKGRGGLKEIEAMKARHLYVGQAGQFALMAELAWRGYHAVTPGIDVGDDIFIVSDADGAVSRVQVKTSKEKSQKKSSAYHFKVKRTAIRNAPNPDLHFAFVMRGKKDKDWRFLLMTRAQLLAYVDNHNVGTVADKGDFLRISITLHDNGRAVCSKCEWQAHLENWGPWPQRRQPIKKRSNKRIE